jgi:hypothetical protein
MLRSIPCFALLLAIPLAGAADVPAPTTAPYRQAIQVVHQIEGTPDEALIDSDAPLNDRTEKFLVKNEKLFALLHEAAVTDQPDWMQNTDDMKALLHELNPVRSLANLGVLRAKYLAQQNQPAQAVDQLLDVIALGRNIDRANPIVVTALVSIGVEEMAMNELAKILPTLPKEMIATLPDRLKQLPTPVKFADLIAGEQAFGGGMLAQQMKQPAAANAFSAMSPFYEAMKRAAEESPRLSAPDFKHKLTDAVSTIKDQPVAVALAQNMVSSFTSFYTVFCIRQAHRAMLESAVLVLRDGDDAIRTSVDPFGDRPFELTKHGNGFELKSKLLDRKDQPLTMRFGK